MRIFSSKGRTIHCREILGVDRLIGIMETPEDAVFAAEALNSRERFLAAERRPVHEAQR